MPVFRRVLWTVPVFSVALLTAPLVSAGPQPPQPPETSKPRQSVDVEVKYVDDSTMKLKLLDDKLELSTKYANWSVKHSGPPGHPSSGKVSLTNLYQTSTAYMLQIPGL